MSDEDRISKIMNDPEKVRKIIQIAINNALLQHKLAGNPVCTLKDGKVVWITPGDILINEGQEDLDK